MDDKGCGTLLAVLAFALVAIWIHDYYGVMGLITAGTIVIAFIAGGLYFIHLSNEHERQRLLAKYQDEEIVRRIMDQAIWQGMSEEQLADSLGNPVAIDDKVLKTKRRQVWKYRPFGTDRYRLSITLENGYVIGWDEKG